MSPQQIQESVNSGELSLINKRAVVIGSDGIRKTVTVTGVTENSIISYSEEFLFADIVEIQSDFTRTARDARGTFILAVVLLAGTGLYVLVDWLVN